MERKPTAQIRRAASIQMTITRRAKDVNVNHRLISQAKYVQQPMYPTGAAGVPRPLLPYAILVTAHKAERSLKHISWFGPGTLLASAYFSISVFSISAF
jgi:hypothetical protein